MVGGKPITAGRKPNMAGGFLSGPIWKRSNAAIFHLLNNLIWWFAVGITLLTEVGGPADPNLNRSSSEWDSFPFNRNFSGYLGLGTFARWFVEWVGLAHRVNGPSSEWFKRYMLYKSYNKYLYLFSFSEIYYYSPE